MYREALDLRTLVLSVSSVFILYHIIHWGHAVGDMFHSFLSSSKAIPFKETTCSYDTHIKRSFIYQMFTIVHTDF